MKSRLSISLQDAGVLFDEVWVLNRIRLALTPGERCALVGANGAGKTLLLKLIAAKIWPTPTVASRRIYRLGGRAISDMEAKPLIAYVGAELQDKYERRGWDMPVRDLLATGMHCTDLLLEPITRAERRRINVLLNEFGLQPLAGKSFLSLSYGQRRLALLARALAGNPHWLLLDELFNGLDARIRRQVNALLRAACRRGQSWIVTAHRGCDIPDGTTRWLEMRNGRVYAAQPCVDRAAIDARDSSARRGQRRNDSRAPLVLQLQNADLFIEGRCVLRRLNWTWRHGEPWAVTGANGSGKSTFLKLLYGDLSPAFGGRIERAGFPTATPIEAWKNSVGFVSPQLQCDYRFDVSLEELVVSGRHSSIGLNEAPTPAELDAAHYWLKFFELAHLAQRSAHDLSYGEARLALFARAMAAAPRCLLLDEPLTGLDPARREFVKACIDRLIARGLNLVVAVHHMEDLPPSVRRALHLHKQHAHEVTLH